LHAHLGAHLHHVLLHFSLDFLVSGHEDHEGIFENVVFDLSILVELVLHLSLLNHHLDHHLHGVATLIHLGLGLHLFHLFHSLTLRFLEVV
jgi:hypothetical protein